MNSREHDTEFVRTKNPLAGGRVLTLKISAGGEIHRVDPTWCNPLFALNQSHSRPDSQSKTWPGTEYRMWSKQVVCHLLVLTAVDASLKLLTDITHFKKGLLRLIEGGHQSDVIETPSFHLSPLQHQPQTSNFQETKFAILPTVQPHFKPPSPITQTPKGELIFFEENEALPPALVTQLSTSSPLPVVFPEYEGNALFREDTLQKKFHDKKIENP